MLATTPPSYPRASSRTAAGHETKLRIFCCVHISLFPWKDFTSKHSAEAFLEPLDIWLSVYVICRGPPTAISWEITLAPPTIRPRIGTLKLSDIKRPKQVCCMTFPFAHAAVATDLRWRAWEVRWSKLIVYYPCLSFSHPRRCFFYDLWIDQKGTPFDLD